MEGKRITGIMACDPSGIIGVDGAMPWRYEAEVQNFLKVVSGGVLIMGRKTFESLPQSLKDKHRCVIFSRSVRACKDENNINFVSSLKEFEQLDTLLQSKLFMIGGAEIARLFLQSNLISEFMLTIVHKKYQGDTKLDLSLLDEWKKEMISTCDDYNVYRYIPNFVQNKR